MDVMDHRGVSAVAGAVVTVLQRSWMPGLLDGVTPEFTAYQSKDFAQPMSTGLSVFVHRVTGTSQLRHAPVPDRQERPGVLLDVHFLLTAWAESAPVEHTLLGWGACALAEQPVLDASLLNDVVPGVCGPGENIHVRADDANDAGQWWGSLPSPRPLSMPFVTSALHLVRG